MSDPTNTSPEPNLVRAALATVALTGVVLAVGGALVGGARTALGVAAGTAVSLVNLWLMSRMVGAFIGGSGPRLPWVLVALLKIGAVFLALFLLVRTGVADLAPLAAGIASLPLGILIAQLRAPVAAARGEGS